MEAPASPCISLCRLNDKAICEGCYRTVEEIQSWSYLDSEQRMAVLSLCSDRASNKQSIG
ncbi:MAG: DUF1289 domain-containing protein [Porticoccaceae bacterium]|nr:DUF1289 domain-containing protein [Porticoccaceae bacterium]